MQFDTVAIWGMGLLGGSFGLALRQRSLARRIIGVGRNAERLDRARQIGACSETTCDLAEGLAEADLAVLCTPVAVLAEALPRLAPLFKEGAIVTDVGSTKRRIVEAAEASMPPGRCFVGSHPMSGSEQSGVEHARADLFVGNPCFLTPTPKSDAQAVAALARLWSALGSRIILADPARHDAVVAAISHTPRLASGALVNAVVSIEEKADYLAAAAGNGFWDTTRLAKGDLAMWTEICQENREEIVERLGRLIDSLSEARRLIRDGGDIQAWLARARDGRLELERRRPASGPPGDAVQ